MLLALTRADVDRGGGERLEVGRPVQPGARLGVVAVDDDVLRLLRAAVLDLDVGVVGRPQLRLLVRVDAVGRAAVPDRGGVPVHVLELVLAGAPVVDVHIDVRRLARGGDRPVCRAAVGHQRCLVLALLLECPADDLVVRAAEHAFARPVERVRCHQRGREVARVLRVGGRCQVADGAQDQVHRHARGKLPPSEVRVIAADRAVEVEQRGREDLLGPVVRRRRGTRSTPSRRPRSGRSAG